MLLLMTWTSAPSGVSINLHPLVGVSTHSPASPLSSPSPLESPLMSVSPPPSPRFFSSASPLGRDSTRPLGFTTVPGAFFLSLEPPTLGPQQAGNSVQRRSGRKRKWRMSLQARVSTTLSFDVGTFQDRVVFFLLGVRCESDTTHTIFFQH